MMVRQWNTYLYLVLLRGIFGDSFILLLIFHHHLALLIFLVTGWLEWTKKQRHTFVLVHVRFFGQFGIVAMIWFLTTLELFIFCRLSTRLRIGSIYGPSSYHHHNGNLWIPAVLGWWRSYGLSSTGVGGSMLGVYNIFRGLCLYPFSWFIQIATIVVITGFWYTILCYFLLNIKAACIIMMQRLGFSPFLKKKKRSQVMSLINTACGWCPLILRVGV